MLDTMETLRTEVSLEALVLDDIMLGEPGAVMIAKKNGMQEDRVLNLGQGRVLIKA